MAATMITNHDLAWMAGIIDLKGRISYKQNKLRVTPQITLTVTSKVTDVVRRMCDLTGTKPEIHASRPLSESIRRGCAEHCPERHIHVLADPTSPWALKWTASGSSLLVVVYNLRPYLTLDHGFNLVEEEIHTGLTTTGRGSEAVMGSCARLRGKGWDLPERLETAFQAYIKAHALPAAPS